MGRKLYNCKNECQAKVVYKRICLRCDKKFKTDCKFIRLCDQCRSFAEKAITEEDLCGTGEW